MTRVTVVAPPGTSVPTDINIRVFLEGGFPKELREQLHREYRLQDSSGTEVAMTARLTQTRLDLTPIETLRPNTMYRLERVYAYDAMGVRIADNERLHADPADVRRAWFAEAEFKTGASAGATGHAPKLRSARLSTRQGGGDCGPGISMQAELDPTSSVAPNDVVELEVRGFGVVASKPGLSLTGPHPTMWASDLLCNPDKVAIPDAAEHQVRFVLIDSVGGRHPAKWTRVARRGNALRKHASRRGQTATAFGGWFDATQETAKPFTGNSPPVCEHGFEVTKRFEAAGRGGPSVYGAQSTVGWTGDAVGLTITTEGSNTQVVRVAPDGTATVEPDVLGGWVEAGWSDRRGGVFVTRTHSKGVSRLALQATQPSGTKDWEVALSPGDEFRIADGIDRLLLTQTVRGAAGGWLSWTLVSRDKGEVLRRESSAHKVDSDAGSASALVGQRFLVAYAEGGQARTVGLIAVSKRGKQVWNKALAIPSDRQLDIVAARERAALVSSYRGKIQLTIVTAAGDIEVGPVEVSAGLGGGMHRNPHVAWDGKMFAVVWERYPSQKVYVAAVDGSGRVSRTMVMSEAAIAGVTATPSGFVASYTKAGGAVDVVHLACRKAAFLGAPQRIAPRL